MPYGVVSLFPVRNVDKELFVRIVLKLVFGLVQLITAIGIIVVAKDIIADIRRVTDIRGKFDISTVVNFAYK